MTISTKESTAVIVYACVALLAQILAKLSSLVSLLLAMSSSSASKPVMSSSSAGKPDISSSQNGGRGVPEGQITKSDFDSAFLDLFTHAQKLEALEWVRQGFVVHLAFDSRARREVAATMDPPKAVGPPSCGRTTGVEARGASGEAAATSAQPRRRVDGLGSLCSCGRTLARGSGYVHIHCCCRCVVGSHTRGCNGREARRLKLEQ